MSASTVTPALRSGFLPIFYLGVLAAIQGTDPQIASSALLSASSALNMGGLNALAASVSTLMLAATVITTGMMADRWGRRRVVMASLLLTVVGDLLVAVAPDTIVFILGRALAGIGLGAVFGASFAYIRLFAQTQKGGLAAALGSYTAVLGGVTVLLTFVGSTLVGVDWRVAFVLIPLVAALCIPFGLFVLPKDVASATTAPWDVLGQLLLGLGIVCTLFGISHAANGLTAPLTVVPFAAGVMLLALWAWWESRNPERRFFPVRLFTQPVFLAAIAAGMLYNLVNGAVFLAFSNTFQYSVHLSGIQVSLSQLPFLLATIPVALWFGRMLGSGRLSRRTVLAIGAVAIAVGSVWFAVVAFSQPTSVWPYLPPLLIVGGGTIIPSIPYGSMILDSADEKHFGVVASSRTTIGQFWYAMGLAIATIVLDALTRAHVGRALGPDAVQQLNEYASAGTRPGNAEVLTSAATGYSEAFGYLMIGVAVLALLGGLVAWALLSRRTATS